LSCREAYLVVAKYTALPEEADKRQVVEAMREIAEILIWGDQNDQAVFEYAHHPRIYEPPSSSCSA
jgi:hypothetical protein